MVGSVPENVAEGSNIKLSFLPLNYFEYKTAANEYREAVACAAVKID